MLYRGFVLRVQSCLIVVSSQTIDRHVRILTFSDSRFTMIHLTQTGFNSLLIHLLPKFSKVQLPIHLVGKSILKN